VVDGHVVCRLEGLLTAVLDTAFGGDDQPIAFGDRPAVRAARAEPDPAKIVYALLSPEVHLILTVERGWPADRYERWIARSLSTLLKAAH
jgi:hypothetical protein